MFTTYLVAPIYNCFVFLIGVMPGGDVGLAIIALTILIRAIFYPAFAASIRTQMGMQMIQGEVQEINTKYADNKEERARRTMELFQKNNIRPLSSLLVIVVQIPVFFALYMAFFREGLPHIATNLLYSFVHAPQTVSVYFLGLVDLLLKHNIPLAALVFGLQFAVAYMSLSRTKKPRGSITPEAEAAQKAQQQMVLYALPALMGVVSYTLPAAVGLYFATGNLFSLGQEWVIRKQMSNKKVQK